MGILSSAALIALVNTAEAGESQMRPDGRDAFKTEVTGFLTTGNPTASEAAMLDETHQPEAFLTVTEFKDSQFRDQLLRQIGEGNTLNQVDGQGHVQFRIGCFHGKQIVSDNLDLSSQEALLSANASQPITVELEFKKGVSGGWECASFADGLRVVLPPSSGTTALR